MTCWYHLVESGKIMDVSDFQDNVCMYCRKYLYYIHIQNDINPSGNSFYYTKRILVAHGTD